MSGREAIAGTLQQIVNDHQSGADAGARQDLRFLAPDGAMLQAVSGIIQLGQAELYPALKAIKTNVTAKGGGERRVASYQNTPA